MTAPTSGAGRANCASCTHGHAPKGLAFCLVCEVDFLLPQEPQAEREYRFAPPRRWRFDLAWPELRLAAEIDGATYVQGRHTRGSGYEKDAEKFNAAALMGWRVLRFTKAMVLDGRAADTIRQALEAPNGD